MNKPNGFIELAELEANEFADLDFYKSIFADMEALLQHFKKTPEYMSWGVSLICSGQWKNRPTLMMVVSGCNHKGVTAWSYDEGADLFRLSNIDGDGKETAVKEEIYFDMILQALDELIERPAEWTDAEYYEHAKADSLKKGFDLDFLKNFDGISIV